MNVLSLFRFSAAAVLLVVINTLPSDAKGQNHTHEVTAKSTPSGSLPNKPSMENGMGQHCKMMMKKNEEREATIKAQDAKLKKLTETMNHASGTKKSSAMQAVINELVAQRTARQEMMQQQMTAMRTHMRNHMEAGGMMSMMQCPMMKSGEMVNSKDMGMHRQGHDMH